MTPKLREEGYIGFIDVNCIVNSNGIYPLEFTSRFGYPTISIQQEGLLTPNLRAPVQDGGRHADAVSRPQWIRFPSTIPRPSKTVRRIR
jgi:hypothetical protein